MFSKFIRREFLERHRYLKDLYSRLNSYLVLSAVIAKRKISRKSSSILY